MLPRHGIKAVAIDVFCDASCCMPLISRQYSEFAGEGNFFGVDEDSVFAVVQGGEVDLGFAGWGVYFYSGGQHPGACRVYDIDGGNAFGLILPFYIYVAGGHVGIYAEDGFDNERAVIGLVECFLNSGSVRGGVRYYVHNRLGV